MYIVQLIIVSILFINSLGCEHPVVNTLQGKVSGKSLKTFLHDVRYYGFMGIPYAEPPVGNLRFMPPKPHKPWDGIIVTDKEKPACAQFNHNIPKRQPFGLYGNEDCLYLDVFTPNLEQKVPVIIFLYNEQFRNSYNKSIDYGPDFFIEEELIIVTLSHRLSILGFLSLEDDILPGNSGLKDIVLALEWVHENIEFFGGDTSRVTLMGLQGGATAIDMLLHSSANNLFHGAILQSGTSWTSQYFQKNSRERAFKLGEILDRKSSNSKKLIKELNEVAFSDILKAEWDSLPSDFYREEQKGLLAFGPVVEKTSNSVISEYPEKASLHINIPIMIGFNSREGIEGSLQYLIEPKYLSFVEKNFALHMPKRVDFKFNPFKDAYAKAVKEIKEFYFSGGKVSIKKPAEFVTYIGDVINMYAIDYTVRHYANRTTKPIYYYHFDYSSGLNENKNNMLKETTVKDGTWGAATGDELCYLFKCSKLIEDYIRFNKTDSEEIVFQRKLIRMWANFAKYRKPITDTDDRLKGVDWKPYDNIRKEYLSIGKTIEVKKNLYRGRFKFWDNFIKKWQKQSVNGMIENVSSTEHNEL